MARTKAALKEGVAPKRVDGVIVKPESDPAGDKKAGKKRRRNRKLWAQRNRKMQAETNAKAILPLAPTERWIRKLAADMGHADIRFSPNAIKAIRHVLIDYGTEVMADGFQWNVMSGGHTLTVPAMKLSNAQKQRQAAQFSGVAGAV